MRTQGQKVLLSSGGMDSALLAQRPELYGAVHVFVDIGQKYLAKELRAASLVAQNSNAALHVVRTMQIAEFEHTSGIIPFRNAEMILCAAQYGTDIYLGVIADEINSDKSPEFCRAIEDVLNISHKKQYWTEGKDFQIHTPFRQWSKTDLVTEYLRTGGSLSQLLQSVSCYSSTDQHCGECASCFKRWVALVNATGRNSACEWGFLYDPYNWKSQTEWEAKLTAYSTQRADEILSAFAIARNVE
ncbi:Queuosine biosynthesis protein QueC [uncultured Caudovirales phage]|uniref:7-cyano-7-deazaguanine synthase n=1 Tax=uncultured Caudovirales phage TaxID=2100421 RepID=A0A6J5RBC8_9CAUD|nr:Queuosine biosynthesis protein QueC [uncultured Caudovirales phage]